MQLKLGEYGSCLVVLDPQLLDAAFLVTIMHELQGMGGKRRRPAGRSA